MKRETELHRRLRSLEALGDAIGAMKSLSAHHFQQARKAVEPARSYREAVERIVGQVGPSLPAGEAGAGILVIGGELGLCGSYNARVVALARERRAALGEGPTLCVGRRAALLLARRGVELADSYQAPASVSGITRLLLRLAQDLVARYASHRLRSFDIVSSHLVGVGIAQPTSVRLLPLSPGSPENATGSRYVSRHHLASAVAREFLYITLYDRLLEAMACEHGARLTATQAAESWLDQRSKRLRRQLIAARREASTQEMLEIATGARARGAMQ